jgi:hypothetical protein
MEALGEHDTAVAELVPHINREMLHHGAEIALLRDLYLWQYDGAPALNPGLGA